MSSTLRTPLVIASELGCCDGSSAFIQQVVKVGYNFAIAQAAFSSLYISIDESDRGTERTNRAWNLRDRAIERKRSCCTTPLRSGLSVRSSQVYRGTPILIRPSATFAATGV